MYHQDYKRLMMMMMMMMMMITQAMIALVIAHPVLCCMLISMDSYQVEESLIYDILHWMMKINIKHQFKL